MRPTRTGTRHFLLAAATAAAIALMAVSLPVLDGHAAATDQVVVVGPGQTLSEIALETGLTTGALASMNGIANPDRIFVGQRLVIRSEPTPAEPAMAAQAATTSHRIAPGESLWGIAQRYGTTVSAIVAANGIRDPSFIRAGQVLAIPYASAKSTKSVSPSAHATAAMPPSMAIVVKARKEVGSLLAAEAERQGVPVAFAKAVAWQESGWRTGVVSSAGAIGVMQLLPDTGDWVSAVMLGAPVNLWDPASNVRAGVVLLKHYLDRYSGDRSLALAAYYQGQAATDRHGIYPVSRPYIGSILALERLFGS